MIHYPVERAAPCVPPASPLTLDDLVLMSAAGNHDWPQGRERALIHAAWIVTDSHAPKQVPCAPPASPLTPDEVALISAARKVTDAQERHRRHILAQAVQVQAMECAAQAVEHAENEAIIASQVNSPGTRDWQYGPECKPTRWTTKTSYRTKQIPMHYPITRTPPKKRLPPIQ